MLTAITRDVSPGINRCELSFLERCEIDVPKAVEQHREYERCLATFGARVISLPAIEALPDSVFVEDPAIVLDEVAVMTRPGALSRRGESETLAAALAPYRPLLWMTEPATLEGGDVMRIGKALYVGASARSNAAGIAQLTEILRPYGYSVTPVGVHGCLHLKSGVCSLGGDLLLANREWVDLAPLSHYRVIDVAPDEPSSANAIAFGNYVLMPEGFPGTAARIAQSGFQIHTVDTSELRKAEAGVTCSSLLLES